MHTIFTLLSIPEFCHVCVYSRRCIKTLAMKFFAQFTSTAGSNALTLCLPTQIFFVSGVVARKILQILCKLPWRSKGSSFISFHKSVYISLCLSPLYAFCFFLKTKLKVPMILKCFVSVRRILILAVSPNEQLKTTCHFPRYVYNSKAQFKT